MTFVSHIGIYDMSSSFFLFVRWFEDAYKTPRKPDLEIQRLLPTTNRSRTMATVEDRNFNSLTAQTRATHDDHLKVAAKPISFVPHPDFDKHEFVHNTLEALPHGDDPQKSDLRSLLHGQDYLLPNRPLLTASGERALFLRMNLLRYMAARREQGLCGTPDSEVCQRTIRNLLEDANIARNEIIEVNQRLVISNAAKFARSGVPLADLISEGNLALMKAVDGFDVSRGFRLSTYATYAIRRHLSRYVLRDQKRVPVQSEDSIDPIIEDTPAEWIDQHPSELVRDILESLAPRECEILKMRFGLNTDGKTHALDVIGRRFGISKERVRQLIARSCAEAYEQQAYRLGIE